MKKPLLILLSVALLFTAGCSKEDDTTPSSEFKGTWNVTTESIVYLNSNNTPFRDEVITEDDIETDPDYKIVITDEVISFESGESVSYTISGKTFTVRGPGGESETYDFTIKDQTMTWKSIKLNHKLEHNGTLYTTIPKRVTTITLEK